MKDGYFKASLIVVTGLLFAAVTWAATDHQIKKSRTKQPVDFGECFWQKNHLSAPLSLTLDELELKLIDNAKECEKLFK